MKTKLLSRISVVILLFIALVTAGYLLQGKNKPHKQQTDESQKKQYVCSMHPQVIRDEPGDCPICNMFLIEKIDQDKNKSDSTLNDIIRPVTGSVLASVSTVTPEVIAMPVTIEAPGIINYDPRKIVTVSARFGGLIERSFVKYQFQHIKKGQKIFEIYCPDIYKDRWNYVKLIQGLPDRDDLTAEALEWFRLLGLSKGQIDSLKKSPKPDYHLAVYCQEEGYAVSRNFDPETFFLTGIKEETKPETFLAGTGNIGLTDGIIVETGTPLFKLIDVGALRADLKVKTEESTLLREGQKVIITDATHPDRPFEAFVSQIEPLNGGLFQTVKVYIKDQERLLLPGRQIRAQINAGIRKGLWVPATTVVDMGKHKSVFVLQNDKFIATGVRTGVRLKDKIEILSGLTRDSKIADKALLLTDSDGFISLVQ